MISEKSRWGGAGKSLKIPASAHEKQRKPRAVPTKPLAKRRCGLKAWAYVSAPQDTPERRQGAPLLEHCGEPPGVRRPYGAATCVVSWRDQRCAASGVVPDDRGVRRERPASQTDRAVPRGSASTGTELRCGACPTERSAAAPA